MSNVRFHLDAADDEAFSGTPLRVLDQEMGLVAQTVTGTEIELHPGRYVAQAILPDGGSAQANFEVRDGEESIVTVPHAASVASRGDGFRQEQRLTLTEDRVADIGDRPERRAPVEAKIDFVPASKIYVRAGRRDPPEYWIEASAPAQLRFMVAGSAASNIVLPISAKEPVLIQFRDHGTHWFPFIRFEQRKLELLLLYRGSAQAAYLLERTPEFQELLSRPQNVDRPVSTALCLYAALKAGRLEAVEAAEWLVGSFPLLADGFILHGETMARMGEHKRALAALSRVPEVGLPVFASGLRLLSGRLSAYRGAGLSANEKFDGTAIEKTWAWLMESAATVDFSRPLLTYRTDASGRPRDWPWTEEDVASAPGLPVVLRSEFGPDRLSPA